MKQLNKGNANDLLLLNQSEFKTGIVHIGLGNFHRAHFAVYTAKAMSKSGGDWGICAFTFRNTELVQNLKSQSNLYSVLEIGPDTEEAYIPNAHSEFIVGYENVNLVSFRIADPNTKIVSLTVTEAGYFIDQKSGGINWEHPDIQNDFSGKSARTIFGIIINGLKIRNSAPITILSCDNISHNGDLVKKLLIEFSSKTAPELIDFIETSVSFPNSMVDRIVPGTEERHLSLAKERLGLEDLAPVPCEKFSMWALEDNFIAGRPDWQDVIFTNEVPAFEQMKLMLLNGSHSLLAYLGGLLDCKTIPDCRFTPDIEKALRQALAEEFLPAVQMPRGLIAENYIEELFGRWSNTVLGDKTYRVGTDGSSKLPQRITKPSLLKLNAGENPNFMTFIVAAWLACLAPIADEKQSSVSADMKDPYKEALLKLPNTSVQQFIETFFKELNIFSEELTSNTRFKELVLKYRQNIYDFGPAKAIELLLAT